MLSLATENGKLGMGKPNEHTIIKTISFPEHARSQVRIGHTLPCERACSGNEIVIKTVVEFK
jgi:hypothetical protein